MIDSRLNCDLNGDSIASITYDTCYFSTFCNNFMYRPVNFLYLFLDISYYWFITIELTAKSIVTAWTKLIQQQIFSVRHIKAFLPSATLHGTLVLHVGDILNSKITKGQKFKNTALNWPWKGHLSTIWAETRGQSFAFSHLNLGALCTSTQICK